MDIRGLEPDETIITMEEYRDGLIRRLLDGDVVLHTMFVQTTLLQSFYDDVKKISDLAALGVAVGVGHELAMTALASIGRVGNQIATKMNELRTNGLTPYEMAVTEGGVRDSKAYKQFKEEVCSTD